MRKRSRSHQLSLCLGGIALAAFARQGQAQLAVTGNMSTTPVTYGPALATQTINTQFGDSTYGGVSNGLPDANGSELDAAYGVVHGGCLNLFLAGNVENNGNILNLFIDDGAAGGQNTLNITSNGYAASSMNGSVFSSGFNANLLLDINDYYGTMYVNHYALNATGSANSYLGSMPLSSGIGQGTIGGIGFGLNNTNVSIMGTEAPPRARTQVRPTPLRLEWKSASRLPTLAIPRKIFWSWWTRTAEVTAISRTNSFPVCRWEPTTWPLPRSISAPPPASTSPLHQRFPTEHGLTPAAAYGEPPRIG